MMNPLLKRSVDPSSNRAISSSVPLSLSLLLTGESSPFSLVTSLNGAFPLHMPHNAVAVPLAEEEGGDTLVFPRSSGAIPSVSKLSPGQAACHFLARYQNGKFMPAYCEGPSYIDPLELSRALLAKVVMQGRGNKGREEEEIEERRRNKKRNKKKRSKDY